MEDYGLSSSFFPFIVAEKDVCSEICTLESVIELADADNNARENRDKALEFINEMGWLLHRSHLKVRLGAVDAFPLERLRWLIEFSIDHDWCAVVKKLLSAVFDGIVELDVQALLDIGVVHRAVRRNCGSMVELLLGYRAEEGGDYLFRPDAVGPAGCGLTPLHVAASLERCESVVDALTEDPGSVRLISELHFFLSFFL